MESETLPMFAAIRAAGAFTFDNRRAIAQGLTFRPLAETIRDTLKWDAAHGRPKAGFQPEQEAALLQKWHARQNNL
ncbi:MAG: hypothetical protein HY741_06415 [Chloroflexi bacterium]|nr:hypothetical protein [Chloroflexota bacterium]